MPFNFKYIPTFRARQQELLVIGSFHFDERMYPMIEIIKGKDRINNPRSIPEIWLDVIDRAQARKILIDLPVYIRDTGSMSDEVLSFNRTVLSNIDRRLDFFRDLAPQVAKIIPVVSSLHLKTGEANTLTTQYNAVKEIFPSVAIRTFTNTFEQDAPEITALLTEEDILIYDLDTILPLNPLVTRQRVSLNRIIRPYKVVLRSAINNEIMNVKLDHGDIIADADNSLQHLFHRSLSMNAFGDYAGIKKDDLNSGGTISPGFIFYDPIDNLYYGYKGNIKALSEFKDTIVPAVLNSPVVARIRDEEPRYLDAHNNGLTLLNQIQNDPTDSGKSQAKFKRIAMEHYLHCMRVKLTEGEFD